MSSEWRSYRLEEVGRIVTGKTPKSGVSTFEGTDVPFISPLDFSGDKWINRSVRAISEVGAQAVKGCIIPARSVLVTCIGSDMGKAAIAASRSVTNQQINAIVVDEGRFCPEFIYYNLSLRKAEIRSMAGGSAQPILNKSAFSRLFFECPSLNEQHRIVEALRPLDDRIALLRETNATLEAIAQALFKSWFVDFDPVRARMEGRAPEGMDDATAALFPDSFEESKLGWVPQGWRLAPLSDAFEINPTRKLKKGELAPYLDMASVGTQGHSVSGTVQREMGSGTKFINGDTLLARITPCLENGKTAFVDGLPEGQTGWGSTEFVVLRPKTPLPVYYAYLLCRHTAFRDFAIQSMSGTSGRQRIQNDVLGRYPVVVPSTDVAEAFGQVVGSIQQKIAANHVQAQTLATLRDTLLPRLISGQLRRPDAEAMAPETA
ncbi:restriction endonuclease subunit S [Methyloversatilis sp.]|uniref:restriction endonuclease subunit S n=1 Tax=Methyloversatilis sp. TaxID=2569862 RepID=UPI00273329B8|nr:restriction endonuclease subunit S [Methyloversatilis sp.]MDP2869521.1 restriction endonuclease subunit S [Methyloversatilis sp.]MDP3456082.1 restriction endonuclease subunit S [Methyloversatilis sp.]MDP3577335.1 restriction endonuclease subunit S [Methyloversatilis sp.]